MRDGSSARSFAKLAVGMLVNRGALALVALLPAPLLHAATASIEGNVVQVLATGDGRFGGCMAALDVAPADSGLDCAGRWVTFSCTGEHAAKEDAHRMFESLRAAVVADKSVEMWVTDEKKHGEYCHASRIKIQDEPDVDEDSDGDGVLDLDDDVPLDASETVDTDDDGVGNNADTDDDNDGVSDADDAFPLDANESVDTDGDGVGDNEDTDDDNDGVSDTDDACPLDSDVTCGQDHAALVALYEATNGPNWVNNDNWLTNAPLGDWYGVNTDSSGRVVRLDLDGRWDSDAREYIPHGLSGPVPTELGELVSLTWLSLSSNSLTGPIPTELGRLADLKSLNLSRNFLSGPIPTELGRLADLEFLQLGGNDLTGPIPTELGELVSLTRLSLSSNSLTGPIPTELGRLADLRTLYLDGNDLTGPIPTELGELVSLTRLSLSSNSLTGPIPTELGRLADLRTLYLGGNDLTGPIPTELGELVSLTSLSLSSNSLTGPIPESFLALDALEWFSFERNADLCAPGTIDFVAWLEGIENPSGPYCNESDVGVLKLLYETTGGPDWTNSGGWLETPALDEWYGVTTDALGRVVTLDLSRNGLAGHLPGILAGLAHMTGLRIGGNALTGPLPLSLARVPLKEFHYADTELCARPGDAFQTWLSGIPLHQGTGIQCEPLSDRDILEIFYNATGGPDWTNSVGWLTDAPLGEWYGVRAHGEDRVVSLFLYTNNLTGPIPPELGNLANLETLRLYTNNLSGSIPPDLGNLASLTHMWLFGNELTGPIPPELGNLASLTLLGLNRNALSGPIPPELGNLASLTWLGLSRNALSGPIPPELGNLASVVQMCLARTT